MLCLLLLNRCLSCLYFPICMFKFKCVYVRMRVRVRVCVCDVLVCFLLLQ